MSENGLTEALERLAAAWQASGAPIATRLASPRSAQETTAALVATGLPVPDELIQWFGWHDGTVAVPSDRYPSAACGIRDFQYRSLTICLERLRLYREMKESQTPWLDSWFPLLDGLGGAAVVAVLTDAPTIECGEYHPAASFEVSASSLEELVNRWARRIEAGAWIWRETSGGSGWTGPDGVDPYTSV